MTTVVAGDYGKPRPGVVIQSDFLRPTDSILICLVTSTLRDAPTYRLSIGPEGGTGLRVASQVQLDKVMAVPRERIGGVIGRLPDETLAELNRRLAFIIGLVD